MNYKLHPIKISADLLYNAHFHMPGIEPWLLGILMRINTKRVLDVGAGLGFWGFMIRMRIDLDNLLIGLDISGDKLMRLKSLNIYDALIRADARHLPFREEAFDLLISVETVHRFLKRKLLMQHEKVLAPNGAIVHAFPTSRKIVRDLLDLDYDVFGVFHGGFLISGGCVLLNIKNGKIITQPTRSIIIRSSVLMLTLIYSLLKLKIVRYCIAIKIKKRVKFTYDYHQNEHYYR